MPEPMPKPLQNKASWILLADGVINLALGLLLMAFNPGLADFLGVPQAATGFYPNIFGGVIFGIGIALFMECFKKTQETSGLGFSGAVAINLCGGFVLTFWLIAGDLNLPLRGQIFLCLLVFLLVGISAVELILTYGKKRRL